MGKGSPSGGSGDGTGGGVTGDGASGMPSGTGSLGGGTSGISGFGTGVEKARWIRDFAVTGSGSGRKADRSGMNNRNTRENARNPAEARLWSFNGLCIFFDSLQSNITDPLLKRRIAILWYVHDDFDLAMDLTERRARIPV